MRAILIAAICCLTMNSNAQTFLEYFFDSDPGFGHGILLEMGSTEEKINLDLSTLSPGFHTVYFRLKGSDGNWGLTSSVPIHITKRKSDLLEGFEYFYDNDPGFGMGNPVVFSTAKTDTTINYEFPAADLATGYHTLYVRSFINGVGYSHTHAQPFYIINNEGNDIVKLEYFIDSDPGFGSAESISFTDPDEIKFSPDFNNISPGFHTLYVRGKAKNGSWSMVSIEPVLVEPRAGKGTDIVKLQYFFESSSAKSQLFEYEFNEPTKDIGEVVFLDNSFLEPGGSYRLTIIGFNSSGNKSFRERFVFSYTNNNPPSLQSTLADIETLEDVVLRDTIPEGIFVDEDINDVLSFTATMESGEDLPAWLSLDKQKGIFLGQPTNSDVGEYSIIVKATDKGNLSVQDTLALKVLNVNDPPETDQVIQDISAQEDSDNFTLLANLTDYFKDIDVGDSLTFGYAHSQDGNVMLSFEGNSLVAGFAPDFFGVDEITLSAHDKEGLSANQSFLLTVESVNDAPVILLDKTEIVLNKNFEGQEIINISISQPENENDQDIVYSLNPADLDFVNAIFSDNQLILTAKEDQFGVITNLEIIADDGQSENNIGKTVLTIQVIESAAPEDILLSNSSIDENLDIGAIVGELSSVDTDPNDSHVYSLVEGEGSADNSSFIIDGNLLKTAEKLDYEFLENRLIRVRSIDSFGNYFEKVFKIMVNDVFENTSPPSAILLTSNSIEENFGKNAEIGELLAIDVDKPIGDRHIFALVSGDGDDDNAFFKIESNKLLALNSFDFEIKSEYAVRIQTTDLGGETLQQSFTLEVINVNESPTAISLSSNSIAENSSIGTVIGQLLASDPDVSESFTFTLVAGSGDANNGEFTIDGNELKTATELDFETQSSYSIRIKVSDSGSLEFEDSFEVTVSNVAEPEIALSDDLEFEDTAIGLFSQLKFGITNAGDDGDLEVSGIQFPDGFSSSVNSLVIAEGQSQEIEVVFEPTEAKSYSGEVVILSNAGEARLNVQGNGIIITSIEDAILKDSFSNVYPNPVTKILEVKISLGYNLQELKPRAKLVSMLGDEIDSRNFQSNSVRFDVSKLPDGVILVVIETAKGSITKKVIVRK